MNSDSREFIIWLFRGRCIICMQEGTDVNEIIPRSRGKDSNHWKNKVLMCRRHHSEYHANGVSDRVISELQEKRTEFLNAMGRKEYV